MGTEARHEVREGNILVDRGAYFSTERSAEGEHRAEHRGEAQTEGGTEGSTAKAVLLSGCIMYALGREKLKKVICGHAINVKMCEGGCDCSSDHRHQVCI